MVYPIGMLGFWICGFALQMGGVGAVGALGGTPPLNHEVHDHSVRPAVRALRPQGLLPQRRHLRRRRVRAVPVPDGVHGHGGHDPDRGDGRALEVLRVHRVRLLHVDVRLSDLRQLGLGRRLAVAARHELRPRSRPRRLRRLVGRPHGRRRRGAGRRDRDRPAHRQVHQGR